MMDVESLPTLNAVLNAVALTLLVFGYACIRRGKVAAHRRGMISAFAVSVLFLTSYVTYHIVGEEKKFTGRGWIRPVYFCILIPHVILAPVVAVLACRMLYLAYRGRFDAHKRLGRFVFPIWVFVSISGVLVYLFLFQWYPPEGAPIAAGPAPPVQA